MVKIRPLDLTPEVFRRIVSEMMRPDKLHVSDEERDEWSVLNRLAWMCHGGLTLWEGYDLAGDGVLVFWDIRPGLKCTVMLVIWGTSFWGPDVVREARALMDDVAVRHSLRKMESETASAESARLARMVGFETEGVKFNSFIRDGELKDVTLLGKCFGGE